MAGSMNQEDMESALQALRAVSQSLGTCIESLAVCQTKLDKSIQCQQFLNHGLKRKVISMMRAGLPQLMINRSNSLCGLMYILLNRDIKELSKEAARSLKPIQTGFVLEDGERSESEAPSI